MYKLIGYRKWLIDIQTEPMIMGSTVVTENFDYKCENPCVILDWITINSVSLKYGIRVFNEYSPGKESNIKNWNHLQWDTATRNLIYQLILICDRDE